MSDQNVTRRRPLVRAVLLAASLVAVLVVAVPGGSSQAAPAGQSRRGTLTPLYAGGYSGTSTLVGSNAAPKASGRAANIIVTYTGFSNAAKASFQAAVNIWKTKITSPVPIRIDARWTNLGNTGILGSAGPFTFWRGTPGTPSNTWQPVALANKLAAQDLSPNDPDIVAQFNNQFPNWYFGTSGPTPANKYDLETVILHEIGHGLGVLTAISNCSGSIRWDLCGNTYPTKAGRLIVNGANKQLITFANGSTALRNAATSNNVFFNGAKAKAANGGAKPKIFAPNPFQQGSSLSHLDENTFPRGNANSLMTPFLSMGERNTNPGAIIAGWLKDIGW